jgi:hypothetical protein
MFGYIIWKVVQVVMRSIAKSRRNQEDLFAKHTPDKPLQTFKDVQDADFEELPPDEKK